MKLIKLTDREGKTHNGTSWKVGASHTVPPISNPQLCSKDVLHAYKNINLALLLNPYDAFFLNPRIYEIEGEIAVEDWGQVGCFSQKVLKKLPIPAWYKNTGMRHKVQVVFAILCAETVLKYFEDEYPKDDRPRKAIEAAKEYIKGFPAADASRAAVLAVLAAAIADTRAADAAYASLAAAYASRAAAYTSDDASRAAAYASRAAADAALAAAYASDDTDAHNIDFTMLADKAVELAGGIHHVPHP